MPLSLIRTHSVPTRHQTLYMFPSLITLQVILKVRLERLSILLLLPLLPFLLHRLFLVPRVNHTYQRDDWECRSTHIHTHTHTTQLPPGCLQGNLPYAPLGCLPVCKGYSAVLCGCPGMRPGLWCGCDCTCISCEGAPSPAWPHYRRWCVLC